MAKKSLLGTLAALGGLAVATAVVYYKRDEIRGIWNNVVSRCFPEEPETEPVAEYVEESDIVIDTTEQQEVEQEDTAEEAPEN